MSQKVIAHKREPTGSLLKQRISSISSDTIGQTTDENKKARVIEKKDGSIKKKQSPEDRSKSRRKALRDFYKLRDQQQRMLNDNVENTSKEKPQTNGKEPVSEEHLKSLELTPETFDEYVSKVDFVQLLLKEDEILEELGNNQSETKSIVYNNYYELIKINDILMSMKEKSNNAIRSSGGKPVKESLLNVKKNLQILEQLDKDIFGSIDESLRKKKNDIEKAQAICHGINRLMLSDQISKDLVQRIDDVLPRLKNESLILQLNELKERGNVRDK